MASGDIRADRLRVAKSERMEWSEMVVTSIIIAVLIGIFILVGIRRHSMGNKRRARHRARVREDQAEWQRFLHREEQAQAEWRRSQIVKNKRSGIRGTSLGADDVVRPEAERMPGEHSTSISSGVRSYIAYHAPC